MPTKYNGEKKRKTIVDTEEEVKAMSNDELVPKKWRGIQPEWDAYPVNEYYEQRRLLNNKVQKERVSTISPDNYGYTVDNKYNIKGELKKKTVYDDEYRNPNILGRIFNSSRSMPVYKAKYNNGGGIPKFYNGYDPMLNNGQYNQDYANMLYTNPAPGGEYQPKESGYASDIDLGGGAGGMDPQARAALTTAASLYNPFLGLGMAATYKVSDTIRGTGNEMTDIYGNETDIYEDSNRVFMSEMVEGFAGGNYQNALNYAKEGQWGKAAGSTFLPGYSAWQAMKENERAKQELTALNERQESLDTSNAEGAKAKTIEDFQTQLYENEDKASIALTQNPKRSQMLSKDGRRVPKYNDGAQGINPQMMQMFMQYFGNTNMGQNLMSGKDFGGNYNTGFQGALQGMGFGNTGFQQTDPNASPWAGGFMADGSGRNGGNFGFDASTGQVGTGWGMVANAGDWATNEFIDNSVYSDTMGGDITKGAVGGFAEGLQTGNLYAAAGNAIIGGATAGIDRNTAEALEAKKEAGEKYVQDLTLKQQQNQGQINRLKQRMLNATPKKAGVRSGMRYYTGPEAVSNPLLANDGLKMAKGAVGEANNGELFIDGNTVHKIADNANPHFKSQAGRPMTGEPFAFTPGGKPTLLNGNNKLTSIYETQQPGGGESLIASNNPNLLDISDDMANKIFNI